MDYNDYNIDIDDYGEEDVFKSELKYSELNILIKSNIEASKKHINDDYLVIKNEGIENIILDKFIPWLKGNDFLEKDNQKILEGLKPFEITYEYKKICDKYSPTNKEDYFGVFEFCFENGNEYTADILEAVAMQVYIFDNKIIKVSGYDI